MLREKGTPSLCNVANIKAHRIMSLGDHFRSDVHFTFGQDSRDSSFGHEPKRTLDIVWHTRCQQTRCKNEDSHRDLTPIRSIRGLGRSVGSLPDPESPQHPHSFVALDHYRPTMSWVYAVYFRSWGNTSRFLTLPLLCDCFYCQAQACL